MDWQAGSLLSVNVGLPRDVSWQGRTVRTRSGRGRSTARGWSGG